MASGGGLGANSAPYVIAIDELHACGAPLDIVLARLAESMTFPEPVIQVAIEPKTKGDQEKLGTAIQKLAEEDPTFRVEQNAETGQTVIKGMGELHLDILVDRMKREFKVEAREFMPSCGSSCQVRRELNSCLPHRIRS